MRKTKNHNSVHFQLKVHCTIRWSHIFEQTNTESFLFCLGSMNVTKQACISKHVSLISSHVNSKDTIQSQDGRYTWENNRT